MELILILVTNTNNNGNQEALQVSFRAWWMISLNQATKKKIEL